MSKSWLPPPCERGEEPSHQPSHSGRMAQLWMRCRCHSPTPAGREKRQEHNKVQLEQLKESRDVTWTISTGPFNAVASELSRERKGLEKVEPLLQDTKKHVYDLRYSYFRVERAVVIS